MLNIMAGSLSSGFPDHQSLKKVDALKRFADSCRNYGTRPCAVTVLTSKTEEIALEEFNKTAKEQVLYYAGKLIEFGFTDIVCSPLEIKIIRQEFSDKLISFLGESHPIQLNTPGVKLPQSNKEDQARVMTPREAIEAGADRLVIGRDITRYVRFHENIAKILAHIKGETA
jgi:orotidine-5'-phosphate decarboxylase